MRFYCIYKGLDISGKLLKKSCSERNIEFVKIDTDTFDFTKGIKFSKNDMLYRVETSEGDKILEKLFIDRNVTTFYKSYNRATSVLYNIVVLEKTGIPVPKTVHNLTCDRNLLKKYVKYLGGFPIIIKILGGSHGIGVVKTDSFSSLFSIVDFILSKDYYKGKIFLMRQFINTNTSARIIVLGNKAIDSIEYFAPKNDFRSNDGETPNVRKKGFSEKIQQIAINAVNALDLEFGGVDILIDKDKDIYVSEVNFPCFFPRCQLLTGTDISGMMIDYLINKSKNK